MTYTHNCVSINTNDTSHFPRPAHSPSAFPHTRLPNRSTSLISRTVHCRHPRVACQHGLYEISAWPYMRLRVAALATSQHRLQSAKAEKNRHQTNQPTTSCLPGGLTSAALRQLLLRDHHPCTAGLTPPRMFLRPLSPRALDLCPRLVLASAVARVNHVSKVNAFPRSTATAITLSSWRSISRRLHVSMLHLQSVAARHRHRTQHLTPEAECGHMETRSWRRADDARIHRGGRPTRQRKELYDCR